MAIDVYDVNIFYIPDLYYEVYDAVDILIDMENGCTFRIPETDFYLDVTQDGCQWFLFVPNSLIKVDIEYVLDNTTEEIQTILLFNLDLFC